MNEQMVILLFLIIGVGVTLFLSIWKAKKSVEYKNDERWQFIQNKANTAANCSNHLLIVLVLIGDMISLFSNLQITFTLNRVLTLVILFIALRNAIELAALIYFNERL